MPQNILLIYIYILLLGVKVIGIIKGHKNPYLQIHYVLRIYLYCFYVSSIVSILYILLLLDARYLNTIYPFYVVLSDIFFSVSLGIIIINSINRKKSRVFCLILCCTMNVLIVFNFTLNYIAFNNQSALYFCRILTFFCEICLSIFYFIELFKQYPSRRLEYDPVFWWITGFFIADCLHLPLAFFFMRTESQFMSLILIKSIVSLIHLFFCIKAISCNKNLEAIDKKGHLTGLENLNTVNISKFDSPN